MAAAPARRDGSGLSVSLSIRGGDSPPIAPSLARRAGVDVRLVVGVRFGLGRRLRVM